jgi:hypothetical protein
MKLPNKVLVVQIEDNTYSIKFPTVRQFLAIENLRMALTDEKYGSMAFSGLKSASFAVDIVDAISAFFTLIPELKEDLHAKSFMDIDPFLAKALVKVYKSKFAPWYNAWLDELLKEDEVGTVDDDQDDENESTLI